MRKYFWILSLVICLGCILIGTEPVGASEEVYSFVVKYKDKVSEKQRDNLMHQVRDSLGHGKGSGKEEAWKRQASRFAKRLDIITIHNPIASERVLEAYNRLPFIEYIEPDYPIMIPDYELFGLETDEADRFTEQLRTVHGEKNVGLNSVTPNAPVVVAVLDTGIDYNHPDLSPYVLAGYNFVEENTDVMDRFGHGTMMAGQILGQESYISLLPVKVISDQGQGNYSDLVEGIYYAVDMGANVINLSLGSQFSSEAVYDAIQYAKDAGVMVLAAAGNYGTDCPIYPAALPGVLAIGGLGNNGGRLGISSYGDNLGLMVAGEEIYSTYLNGTYKSATGTSMATAIAANMAAQLIGQRPELDAFAVMQVLKATATDLGRVGWDRYTGFGAINLASALEYQVSSDLTVYRVEQNIASPLPGQSVQVEFYVRNAGVQTTYESALNFMANGVGINESVVPMLMPGEETKIFFNWLPAAEGVYNLTGEIRYYDANVANNQFTSVSEVTATVVENVEIANLFAYYGELDVALHVVFDLVNKGNVAVQMPLNVLCSNKPIAENEVVTIQPGQVVRKEYSYVIDFEAPEGCGDAELIMVNGVLSNGDVVCDKLSVNIAGCIEPLFEGNAHKLITQYLIETWGKAYSADGFFNGGSLLFSYRVDMVEGSVKEDEGVNWLSHGWDPDKGVYAGWGGASIWPVNSAYERSIEVHQIAMEYCRLGNFNDAFKYAGRVIHLLEDMAVPSHAHGDMHPFVEYYEKKWIPLNLSNRANLQKYGLKVETWQVPSSRQYTYPPLSTLADYKGTLMYQMAEIADNFDSEDAVGEASYGDLKRCTRVLESYWTVRWVKVGCIMYPVYVKEYRWVNRYYWVSNAGEIIAKNTLPILSDYVFDTLYWYKDLIK